jgi:hypothetical protein
LKLALSYDAVWRLEFKGFRVGKSCITPIWKKCLAGNAWDIGMHRKIIETTLSGLDAERASYFGDIANRLQADARAEPNANMVFTVLGDVMGELPTYLEAAELIGLLLEFTNDNEARLRQVMFSPEFVETPKIIRTVTGDFMVRVVGVTMDDHGEPAEETSRGRRQKLTWPYRETDLVDPEDEPEAWAEALGKSRSLAAQPRHRPAPPGRRPH